METLVSVLMFLLVFGGFIGGIAYLANHVDDESLDKLITYNGNPFIN